jgi:hypothetical protein
VGFLFPVRRFVEKSARKASGKVGAREVLRGQRNDYFDETACDAGRN